MAKPQYGYEHQQERAEANRRLEAFGPIPCRWCQQLVYCDAQRHLNRDGRKFQLGHGVAHVEGGTGDDKQPEHTCCNEAAGGRLAAKRRRADSWQQPDPTPGPRIVVVLAGPPGAGKTTIARASGLHVYDADDYPNQPTFRAALDELKGNAQARAVVIRTAASSYERDLVAEQVDATHVYLVDEPDRALAKRIQTRGRGHMVAVAQWRKAFDDDDDVQPFPGWQAIVGARRAARHWQ